MTSTSFGEVEVALRRADDELAPAITDRLGPAAGAAGASLRRTRTRFQRRS